MAVAQLRAACVLRVISVNKTPLSFVGLFWTEYDAHEPIFPFSLCHYLVQWVFAGVYLGGPERVRAAVWPINSYFAKLLPRLWYNFGRHLKM